MREPRLVPHELVPASHPLPVGTEKFKCKNCGREWDSSEVKNGRPSHSVCPKIKFYEQPPTHIFTRTELAQKGYGIGDRQSPKGYSLEWGDRIVYYWSLKRAIRLKHCYKSYLISKSGLKHMGWTDGAILKYLGEPDVEKDNPHHKKFAPMQLFDATRVDKCYDKPEFFDWYESRMKKLGRPRYFDAVLGGQNSDAKPEPGSAVLGGKTKKATVFF